MKKKKRMAAVLVILFFAMAASCGSPKEELDQVSFGNHNAKKGIEALFEGTVLEELKLFKTTMDEAKQVLDDHNIAYKLQGDDRIVTTILDEMSGYGCYYQLEFASNEEEQEPFLVVGSVRVFFRDDKEYREGLGRIKDCFQASVLEGYEMKQYNDLISYSNFSNLEGVGNLYWYPLNVITEEFLKIIPEDAFNAESEEILKKMKEEKVDFLEVAEMVTVHVEGDQEERDELIPQGYLSDMVCFSLRAGVTGEYDRIREEAALQEKQEQEREEAWEEAYGKLLAGTEENKDEDGTTDDNTGQENDDAAENDDGAEEDADDGAVNHDTDDMGEEPKEDAGEEWKSQYLTYLDGLEEEIFDYQIADINYDGIPELIIWYDVPSQSCTFRYINGEGEVKESASGTVYYNEDYVYCEGGISGSEHITFYQYNEGTKDYDVVCSASSSFWDESATYTIDDAACSAEEYNSRLETYRQGEFTMVYGEKEQGRGEISLQEAIKNYE